MTSSFRIWLKKRQAACNRAIDKGLTRIVGFGPEMVCRGLNVIANHQNKKITPHMLPGVHVSRPMQVDQDPYDNQSDHDSDVLGGEGDVTHEPEGEKNEVVDEEDSQLMKTPNEQFSPSVASESGPFELNEVADRPVVIKNAAEEHPDSMLGSSDPLHSNLVKQSDSELAAIEQELTGIIHKRFSRRSEGLSPVIDV